MSVVPPPRCALADAFPGETLAEQVELHKQFQDTSAISAASGVHWAFLGHTGEAGPADGLYLVGAVLSHWELLVSP